MRMKFTALLLVGICFTTGLNSAAAEDVYVDLSVLNDLQPAYAGQNVSQPLFPIVEKSSPRVAADKPASKPKKKAKKAPKAPVQKVSQPQPVVKPEASASKAVEPAPTMAEDKDELSSTTMAQPAQATLSPDANSTPKAPAPSITPSGSDAKPDALRDSIQRSQDRAQKAMDDAQAALPQSAPQPASSTVDNTIASQNQQTSQSVPASQPTVSQIETNDVEQGLGLEPNPQTPADSTVYAPQAAPEAPASSTPDTVSATANPAPNAIKFTPDEDELSANQQQQLDAILSAFVNPSQNKIAITSYNVEGGDDVFRRKRISLNRATGIRSYFLNKGYKNFSIKIVNIPSGDPRTDTVEIVELQ